MFQAGGLRGVASRLVGLTGGIGSGKTTVSAALAQRGAVIVDADASSMSCRHAGTFAAMVKEFGEEILDSSGQLNRAVAAHRVLGDQAALARLGEIVHPPVREKDFRSGYSPRPTPTMSSSSIFRSSLNLDGKGADWDHCG